MADDENALTSAEAEPFKRACACLGLRRYLYHFTGTWVDLDEHRRPNIVPQPAGWATPSGWLRGSGPIARPSKGERPRTPAGNRSDSQQNGKDAAGDNETLRDVEWKEC